MVFCDQNHPNLVEINYMFRLYMKLPSGSKYNIHVRSLRVKSSSEFIILIPVSFLHNHKNLNTNTKKTKYTGLYYSTEHGHCICQTVKFQEHFVLFSFCTSSPFVRKTTRKTWNQDGRQKRTTQGVYFYKYFALINPPYWIYLYCSKRIIQ